MPDTHAPPFILAVCSGNICRSPLVEAYVRAWGARQGLPLTVASGGTLGIIGRPAEPSMVTVSDEVGIDLRAHRSQALTAELLEGVDFVLCMELEHALAVRELAPALGEQQVVMLGAFGGHASISDPMGSWTKGPYRKARDLIITCLDAWLPYALAAQRA